ncbi:hypothetical protein GCM10010417_02320 [Streptomyces carpaticus]
MAVGGASGTERTDGATGPLPEVTGTGPVAAVRRPAGDPELPAGSAGERVLESERYRALRDALAHLLAAPPLRAGAGTGRGVRTGAVTWAGDSALFGKTRVHACRVGVPAPGGPASACPEADPVRGR